MCPHWEEVRQPVATGREVGDTFQPPPWAKLESWAGESDLGFHHVCALMGGGGQEGRKQDVF